jgi:YcxB-like protein
VTKPVEISYAMTDADLYAMVMHSKSRTLGWSGHTMVKVFMGTIALAFAMMAFGLPGVMGIADDDPGKVPFQFSLVAAGVVLVVLYPGYAKWYTRRVSAAYQTLPLALKLLIDDAGIQAQLDGQSGFTAWKLIERAVETDTHVFLYLNRLRGYTIPKTAFNDDVELGHLRQLIAVNVVTKA